ncbi:HEAT repeat domain-containing protein [Sphingomonas sp. LaA6.9]|uniref:HEAT repeat domain-containing protein n=1 Tax=Sphingomonas sp. LaA6.9 TaxID=2919914 RepID=UPI001F500BBD|nr:HEAT repeat domain-containing protein [Sphingomonas sp. LaA6.9]MCJ8159892.1 HEAT repeat domain-containing protein [Sphingomonas sp. LaA6.9]
MNSLANDPRSTPDLFRTALQSDSDHAWDAVAALHWRGSKEVLDRALALSSSENVSERARAADILGQLGIPERTFPNQCFDALLHLLSDDAQQVVFSAIFGIQHLDRVKAAPHVLPFANHQDDNIRYAAAFALGAVNTPDAIAALLMLMGDGDDEVRNWATFGVGQQSEADSEEIRAALAARLNDDDPDVRYEAICGLGRRRDGRAMGFLKTILHDDPDDTFAREAAAKLLGLDESRDTATSELLGALQRRQRWTSSRAGGANRR